MDTVIAASCYTSTMLWTMLTLMGAVCFLLGSIDAARHPPMPVGVVIGAVCLGVLFAALNFWAWTKFADSVIDPSIRPFTVKKRERALAALAVLYAIALLWAPIAGVLSNALTHVLLGGLGR
jgi:hypothetical protein